MRGSVEALKLKKPTLLSELKMIQKGYRSTYSLQELSQGVWSCWRGAWTLGQDQDLEEKFFYLQEGVIRKLFEAVVSIEEQLAISGFFEQLLEEAEVMLDKSAHGYADQIGHWRLKLLDYGYKWLCTYLVSSDNDVRDLQWRFVMQLGKYYYDQATKVGSGKILDSNFWWSARFYARASTLRPEDPLPLIKLSELEIECQNRLCIPENWAEHVIGPHRKRNEDAIARVHQTAHLIEIIGNPVLAQDLCYPKIQDWYLSHLHQQLAEEMNQKIQSIEVDDVEAIMRRQRIVQSVRRVILSRMERGCRELLEGFLSESCQPILDQFGGDFSVHQLRALMSQAAKSLVEGLWKVAIVAVGTPPCAYCLIGAGSMARGEMGLYSDCIAPNFSDTFFHKN